MRTQVERTEAVINAYPLAMYIDEGMYDEVVAHARELARKLDVVMSLASLDVSKAVGIHQYKRACHEIRATIML